MLKDSVKIAFRSEQMNDTAAAHQNVYGTIDLILIVDYQTRKDVSNRGIVKKRNFVEVLEYAPTRRMYATNLLNSS